MCTPLRLLFVDCTSLCLHCHLPHARTHTLLRLPATAILDSSPFPTPCNFFLSPLAIPAAMQGSDASAGQAPPGDARLMSSEDWAKVNAELDARWANRPQLVPRQAPEGLHFAELHVCRLPNGGMSPGARKQLAEITARREAEQRAREQAAQQEQQQPQADPYREL